MPDRNREEIEKLEKLYASNPAGRVFTHLAEAYRKAGELDRSGDILDSGLQLHPDYPSAYVVLGRVKQDLGEKEEAAAAFRRVLELDRHNMVALRALGDMAMEEGRFDEARHYLGELVQIDPGDLELAEQLDRLPEELTAEAAIDALGIAPVEAEPEGEADDLQAAEAGVEPEVVEAPALPEEPEDFAPAGATEEIAPVAAGAEAGSSDEWAKVGAGMEEPAIEAGDGEQPADDEQVDTLGEEDAGGTIEAVDVEDASKTVEPERAAAPLDAWVESLTVLDPELQPDRGPIEETIAVASEDSAAMEGEPIVESVEVNDVAEDGYEDVIEMIVPDPEEADTVEPEGDVITLEVVEQEDEEAAEKTDVDAGTEEEPVETQESIGPDAAEDQSMTGEEEARPDEEATWLGDPAMHAKVPDPVEWVSQEDWERIAALATWSETEESAEAVEAVPPIDSDWGEAERDEDADEVATETLAEVYAAQGFRTEAAAIYRKLLRLRPEDERLLARLAELEGEGEQAEPEGLEAIEAGVPTTPETGEATWPGGEEQAVAGPTPYAWMDAGAGPEPEAGTTIGDHLRGILAWRPEARPEPESEPTLLLDEVAEEPPGGFTTFAVPAEPAEAASPAQDAESEDLEMFRSWLKSLRK